MKWTMVDKTNKWTTLDVMNGMEVTRRIRNRFTLKMSFLSAHGYSLYFLILSNGMVSSLEQLINNLALFSRSLFFSIIRLIWSSCFYIWLPWLAFQYSKLYYHFCLDTSLNFFFNLSVFLIMFSSWLFCFHVLYEDDFCYL